MTQEFRRREISRDGVRLSYLDNDAAGPVVMLLHGLAGAGDEFTATARAVGAPYRFVLPDLRGHGASTRRSRGPVPGRVHQRRGRAAGIPGQVRVTRFPAPTGCC
jgi:pimeloyl-ACP methyl ester carboxylesterase